MDSTLTPSMINILLLSFTVSDYKFNVSLYFSVFLITHPKIKLILHFIKQCSSYIYLLYRNDDALEQDWGT